MQDINLEELLHKSSEVKANKKDTNLNPVARKIIHKHDMIFYGDSFFAYHNGRYSILNDNEMKKIVYDSIQDAYNTAKCNQILDSMIAQCQVKDINTKSGVNLLNGVFDFDTQTLIPHDPGFRFVTQVQANYDPSAQCPKWIAFLEEMLGDDPTKVDILQEYAGYSLDYSANVEMVLFLLGRGANGKSVVCDTLKAVIGYGNYDTISLDDLRNKNYIAELLGKLINISTESQAKAEVYESSLKKLASGEEFKVDRKFKHPFSFKSNCKHIYSLNNLPRVSDKTDAFFRRVITLPFNRQVESSKRILKLGEIIGKQEASGILNWMICGYYRLMQNSWKFTRSQQAEELIAEYRRDNNNVLNFVDEKCILEDGAFLSNGSAYRSYQDWCKDTGVQPLKLKGFIHEIVENYKTTRDKFNGERGMYGIKLSLFPL